MITLLLPVVLSAALNINQIDIDYTRDETIGKYQKTKTYVINNKKSTPTPKTRKKSYYVPPATQKRIEIKPEDLDLLK